MKKPRIINISNLTRENWEKTRKPTIGGSDIGTLLDYNPHSSPVQLWKEKTDPDFKRKETDAMRWGHLLESPVASEYARQKGVVVNDPGQMFIREGVLSANLDRLVYPEGTTQFPPVEVVEEEGRAFLRAPGAIGILECKTTLNDDGWDDNFYAPVPDSYYAQVQHYLSFFPELQWADIAVFVLMNRSFKIIRIQRDDAFIESMSQRAIAWHKAHIIKGIAPEPRNESDVLSAITPNGMTITATPALVGLINAYKSIQQEEASLKIRKQNIRDKLAVTIGGNEVILFQNGDVACTYKQNKPSVVVDWEGIVGSLAPSQDLIDSHTTHKPGNRVLRMTNKEA